jgi:hypothetical protein
MRTGLGVETEGAECAEILELGETFAVEGVDRILGWWCLNSNHDVRLVEFVEKCRRSKCKSYEILTDGSAGVSRVVIRKSRS